MFYQLKQVSRNKNLEANTGIANDSEWLLFIEQLRTSPPHLPNAKVMFPAAEGHASYRKGTENALQAEDAHKYF